MFRFYPPLFMVLLCVIFESVCDSCMRCLFDPLFRSKTTDAAIKIAEETTNNQ